MRRCAMPEIDFLTVIIAAGTFCLGLLMAFLVQSGKISSIRRENSFYKTENERLSAENLDYKSKCERLVSEISEKERIIAVRDALLEVETFRANDAERKNTELSEKLSRANINEAAANESKKWIENAQESLKDSFASISKTITENNNRVFLESANDKVGGIVAPVSNELKELRTKVEELEQKRALAYGSLTQQVEGLQKQNSELKNATELLNSILCNNAQRGKWGEEQLRRIAELAGMVEHIDFEEQEINNDKNRPDMVIHLTGGRSIPVDSKAPMNSYLACLEDKNEAEREKHLKEHAKALRQHIDALYNKAYWGGEDRSAGMVAMVVPYESGLSAAFTVDREIFGYAMEKNVLLLSPMTFYAFLKSVSVGWQESAISKNAKEIAKQSMNLIRRFEKFSEHLGKIDSAINSARKNFDEAMGSYNKRLVPVFNNIKVLTASEEQELLQEGNETEE